MDKTTFFCRRKVRCDSFYVFFLLELFDSLEGLRVVFCNLFIQLFRLLNSGKVLRLTKVMYCLMFLKNISELVVMTCSPVSFKTYFKLVEFHIFKMRQPFSCFTLSSFCACLQDSSLRRKHEIELNEIICRCYLDK